MTKDKAAELIDKIYSDSLKEEKAAYNLPVEKREKAYNEIRQKERLLIDSILKEVSDGS